jgi:LssY C-terminus
MPHLLALSGDPDQGAGRRTVELKRALRTMRSGLSKRRIILSALAIIVAGYGVLAYVVLPLSWRHYEHQKGLAGLTMVTRTRQGIPGDAINVGLVGAGEDVLCAMHAAGWYPADPITLQSSLKIVGSVILDRPYRDAPVSRLFYEGRHEDLAFEKPAGRSADRRHHVRLWEVLKQGQERRPVWLGAVTFDRDVGLSHYTGQITHHIAPDIDAERNGLIGDLKAAKAVVAIYEVTGIGPTLYGRNGEGDRYYTDGEIKIARLVAGCNATSETAVVLDNPPMVVLKNKAWQPIAALLKTIDRATAAK